MVNVDYNKRKYGLDIVRAAAILMVVFAHSKKILVPFWSQIQCIYVDYIGVNLFFVLSGFLIGSIIINTLDEEKKYSFMSAVRFWKRRWVRTLPNYYLVLLLYLIVAYFQKNNFSAFNYKYLIFTKNFINQHPSFFELAWSLAVEEWFYLLLPLSFLLFSKIFKRNQEIRKIILTTITIFIFTPLLVRILYLLLYGTKTDLILERIVIFKLDAVMYGVLTAYIKRFNEVIWYKYKNQFFYCGITIITIITFCLPLLGRTKSGFIFNILVLPMLSLGMACLMPKADSLKEYRTTFSRIVCHISVVSYSMYLIHNSLIFNTIYKYFFPATKISALITCAIGWFLAIFFSTILYNIYEKPIMDLRTKIA